MDNSAGGILSRDALIGLDAYWRIVKYDYQDGLLVYKGTNTDINAEDTADTWVIWKYFYDGVELDKIEGPITGEWESRSDLKWPTGTQFVNRTAKIPDNMVVENSLSQILTTLKKIEYHLSIASDTNLNDQDV